jgi:hypothetical protein
MSDYCESGCCARCADAAAKQWPTTLGGAREAVTRAIECAITGPDDLPDYGLIAADAALAALKPIIATEIRAWAENEMGQWATPHGVIRSLDAEADRIASRICGGGE